ncbi:decapping and exoribonuclease protein Rai1-like isoform X2 [Eurosta solidaginis]|uniref:decapping and exoribonuclease protein Rai1-like isoform X2 n=1 Tax=Eurosta solidaginis TaxID=178769 RepID=UPI0035306CCF
MAKNKRDGFKIISKLSYHELTDETNKPAFYLKRPKLCAIYQLTKTDEIIDAVRLKYFKIPKSYPIDLNKGFETYIFRKQNTPSQQLNKVFKFILEANENILRPYSASSTKANVSKTEEAGSKTHTKPKLVLCQRGVLARLMLIPYRLRGSQYNDTTVYATRYCGILHLVDPVQWLSCTKNDSYHGKFEQVCFSDDPHLDPLTDVPVDDNITTFGIFRSNIQDFDLIYSAEVSGVTSDHKIIDIRNLEEINQCKFIQTKLLWNKENRDILTHPKCLLWWAQLYLANTNDICIGRKDRDGVVRTPAQLIKVQNMPKLYHTFRIKNGNRQLVSAP